MGQDVRYYTIGEAADMLGISIPTLRLYEREGLIIPYRRETRHRRFTECDLDRVRCIREMINRQKISKAGIKRLFALIPCWKVKNCSGKKRDACPAFKQQNEPCWVVTNRSWQQKCGECRECKVYTDYTNCRTLKESIAKFTVGRI